MTLLFGGGLESAYKLFKMRIQKHLFLLLFSLIIWLPLQGLRAEQVVIDIGENHAGSYLIPYPGRHYLDTYNDLLYAEGSSFVTYLELDLSSLKEAIGDGQQVVSAKLQVYGTTSIDQLGVYRIGNSEELTGNLQTDFDAGRFPLANTEQQVVGEVPLPSESDLLYRIESLTYDTLAEFDITEYIAQLAPRPEVDYAGLIVASPNGLNLLYSPLAGNGMEPKLVVELGQIPEPSAYAVLLGVPLLLFAVSRRRCR